MRTWYAAALAVILLSPLELCAQIAFGGEPLTVTSQAKLATVSFTALPSVDVASLLLEDQERVVQGDKRRRFGVERTVDLTLANAGTWNTLPDGRRVWRVGIECPQAACVGITFDRYEPAVEGKVFVVSNTGEFMGAFTRESSGGANAMAVLPIAGSRVVVEYQVPAGVDPGRLGIGRVVHGYTSPDDERGFNASGSCNNNVVCPEGTPWNDQIKAVAKIINGGDWCTGQLINNCNSNGTPYFLTANHCTSGQTVGNWVFLFNYQSATCTPSANGPTTQTISGASLLYNNAGSDVALLQLSSTPPAAYNTFYTGWDKSGTTPVNQTCIHHPNGDVKKISFDNNSAAQATYSNAACWRILGWDDGTTEPGSSGSGLWDQNHRLIGQLYGGQATCSNNVNDYFGRFDVSYPALSTWLGSCGNTLDGYDPNAPVVALDAQLLSINAFSGSTCSASRTPTVTVRNGGTATLTSFTLTWSLNGGANTVVNWTGTLASGASTVVNLPTLTLPSAISVLSVALSAPNAGTDLNAANNSATATSTYGTNTVTLNLNLDRYGDETTWQIVQGAVVVASGGPYTQQASNGVYPQAPITICLPDGCFDLKVADVYGDGICCTYGSGNYNLVWNGNTIVSNNGQFGALGTTNFCIAGGVKVAPKMFLEGAYDQGTGMMYDSLRVRGMLPLTEPYTGLGYAHAGGGGETTTASVLAVTGANAIVDWVVVELRNSSAPAVVSATKCGLLQRDGDVVAMDGASPITISAASGNYYVAVRHRNHLGCMTSAATALSGTAVPVNFTSTTTTTWGSQACKTIGTVNVLWGGNATRDNTLLYTGAGNDRDPILVRIGGTVPTNTVSGYSIEDVNLDGTAKYTGARNDRDPILVNIGGTVPTASRMEQLP